MNSRRAILFHGTGGNPTNCWYPWLKHQLEQRDYLVEIPHYPDLNREPIETFLPKLLSRHTFDEQTVLVGHSAGAALLLAILQHIQSPVSQAILVAGYITPPNTKPEPVLQSQYNFEKIKQHVLDLYFVNSITDPYGCDDKQGRAMFTHLGGTQIIRNEGHFGSAEQDYPTFDLLNRLIK